jgi:hypothetical protein
MSHFIKFPHWVITIFSLLCLVQVRTWFEELVENVRLAQNSFNWRGERFSILPNRSFIVDESLAIYGIKVGQHTLN